MVFDLSLVNINSASVKSRRTLSSYTDDSLNQANAAMTFFVYILECSDCSYYVGSTSDVDARVKEHNEGKLGASYMFMRRPVKLVYTESSRTQLEAMQRERQLKGWSHAKKAALIYNDITTLKALSKRRKP